MGQTKIQLETPEPALEEVRAAYPEGVYQFRGETVDEDDICASCHKIRGEGSASGPDLSFMGRVHETEWLKTYIRDPDSLNPQSSMPPYRRLAEEDLDHLAAYLKSLQ